MTTSANLQKHTNPTISSVQETISEMKQDTENPVKSKISIPKSPEGISSYLQSNESTDNDYTELQTELKLSTNEKEVMKKSDIENPIVLLFQSA